MRIEITRHTPSEIFGIRGPASLEFDAELCSELQHIGSLVKRLGWGPSSRNAPQVLAVARRGVRSLLVLVGLLRSRIILDSQLQRVLLSY
jgi:hypothetical protein